MAGKTTARKRVSAEDRALLKRMKEIRELLAEFGIHLAGHDPGVTAIIPEKAIAGPGVGAGYFGEHLAFDDTEWAWLEPLLKELRAYRRQERLEDPDGRCLRCGGTRRITVIDPSTKTAQALECPTCKIEED